MPVVKVRIPELPLTSAWLDCSIMIVKAREVPLHRTWHRIGPHYISSAIKVRSQSYAAILRMLCASVTCRKFVKLSFISGAVTFFKVMNFV